MGKVINIGIIGCGYWGLNYIRVFKKVYNSRVIACCDISKNQTIYINRQFPGIKVTNALEEVLADCEIDAVVVSTPAATHYQIVRESLSWGKHTLVEKPLALNAAQAEELINLAKAKNKILMVAHTFLYNPAVLKIKEYINRSDFGDVCYLRAARTHSGPIRNDVDVIWDLAPHDISIFCYLLNAKPVWVGGIGRNVLGGNNIDAAFVSLIYPKGIIGHIHVSWVDFNKVRQIEIVGSKKSIIFDDSNKVEKIKIYGDIDIPKVEMSEPLENQCKHFLNCIETDKTPLTDGQNGIEIVKIVNAIEKSLMKEGHSNVS